jgi:hypothetical protein
MIAKKSENPKGDARDGKSSKKEKDKKKTQVFQLTELLKSGNKIIVPQALTALTCGGEWQLSLPLAGGTMGCVLKLPDGQIIQNNVVLELLSIPRELAKLVKKEETSGEITDVIRYIAAYGGGVGTAVDRIKVAIESIKARNKNAESFSAAIRGMTEYSTGKFSLATQILLDFYAGQIELIGKKITDYMTDLCTKARVAKLTDWFTEDGTITQWFLSRVWRDSQLSSMNGYTNIFQLMCAGKALTFTEKEYAIYGARFEYANFSTIVDTKSIWMHFSTAEEKEEFLKTPKMTKELMDGSVNQLPVILFNGDHIMDYMPAKGSALLKAYTITIPKIPGGERLSSFITDVCGRLITGKSTRNDAVDVKRLASILPVVPPLRKVEVLDHFAEILQKNSVGIYQKKIFLAPDLFGPKVTPGSYKAKEAAFLIEGAMPHLPVENRGKVKDAMNAVLTVSIKAFSEFDPDTPLDTKGDGTVFIPRATAPENPRHLSKDNKRVLEIKEAKDTTSDLSKKKKSQKQKTQQIKLLPIIEEELRNIYDVKNLSQPIIDVIGKLKIVPLQREAIRILHHIKAGNFIEAEHAASSGSESSSDEDDE